VPGQVNHQQVYLFKLSMSFELFNDVCLRWLNQAVGRHQHHYETRVLEDIPNRFCIQSGIFEGLKR